MRLMWVVLLLQTAATFGLSQEKAKAMTAANADPNFSAVLSLAVQSNAASLGASVENIRYSDDMTSAIVSVQNTSQKNITAINLAITVEFKDGHQSHFELLRDVLSAMTSRRERTGADSLKEGSVVPGSVLDFTVSLQKNALAIKAGVNAVVYLDLSGEGDNQALTRIAKNREEYAQALEEGTAIISSALASTVTQDAREMARHKLNESLANLSGSQKGVGMREMAYRMMLDDLQRPLSRSDLQSYALHRNQEAESNFSHSKIRRSN